VLAPNAVAFGGEQERGRGAPPRRGADMADEEWKSREHQRGNRQSQVHREITNFVK